MNLNLGYLINQSKEFTFAIVFSFFEYLIGFYFFPGLKYNLITFVLGAFFPGSHVKPDSDAQPGSDVDVAECVSGTHRKNKQKTLFVLCRVCWPQVFVL